jgi:hypothetical protein
MTTKFESMSMHVSSSCSRCARSSPWTSAAACARGARADAAHGARDLAARRVAAQPARRDEGHETTPG